MDVARTRKETELCSMPIQGDGMRIRTDIHTQEEINGNLQSFGILTLWASPQKKNSSLLQARCRDSIIKKIAKEIEGTKLQCPMQGT